MWALSKQLKNTMTHMLRVEDVSIEWAGEKHEDAQTESRRCEHWVSRWKTRRRTNWESKMWALSEQLENTTTHLLRVEYVSIEWAVEKLEWAAEKHDDAPPESKMWALSEQLKNTTTHRLIVEDVSIEWGVEKHDDAPTKSRRCEHWVRSWKTRRRTS